MEENKSYWLKLSTPITLACFSFSRRLNVRYINYLVPEKKKKRNTHSVEVIYRYMMVNSSIRQNGQPCQNRFIVVCKEIVNSPDVYRCSETAKHI